MTPKIIRGAALALGWREAARTEGKAHTVKHPT